MLLTHMSYQRAGKELPAVAKTFMKKTLAPGKTSSPSVTECTQSSFPFAKHFRRQVSAQFDGGAGTLTSPHYSRNAAPSVARLVPTGLSRTSSRHVVRKAG